jgi:hypothetical protein
VPLGDLTTTWSASELNLVPFIQPAPGPAAGYVAYVSSWQAIWNDHGAANPNSMSGWYGPDSGGYVTLACAGGTGGTHHDGYSSPGMYDYAALDTDAWQTCELGSELWDDAMSGADEDCIVYAHPQFGQYGLYWMFRSHSRPDPDTVPCLDLDRLAGHPYVPPPAAG